MSSDSAILEAMTARLLAEAQRDLALMKQLAAKYPDELKRLIETTTQIEAPSGAVLPSSVEAPPASVPNHQLEFTAGTIGKLIADYRTDKDSPFSKVRFNTRQNYESSCRRIEKDRGPVLLSSLTGRDLLRWHEEWSASGHVALAHGLIGQVKRLFSFGASVLEDPDCQRLSGIASKMRFKMSKRRTAFLTLEHVNNIRAVAHKMGFPSIALAQAFQYEVGMAQKDVVGEYVPLADLIAPSESEFIFKGQKAWQRGLRWSEIDQDMILRHTTSRDQVLKEIDLRQTQMIFEELERFNGDRSKDPIIIYEDTGKPYLDHQFRRIWRKIATAAGVPKEVENRDSKNEAPVSRRAPHVSPSKGNRLANDPSASKTRALAEPGATRPSKAGKTP